MAGDATEKRRPEARIDNRSRQGSHRNPLACVVADGVRPQWRELAQKSPEYCGKQQGRTSRTCDRQPNKNGVRSTCTKTPPASQNGANSGDMTLDYGASIGAIQLASICTDLHRFALKSADVGQGRAWQETQQAPSGSELMYCQLTTCVELDESTRGGTRTLTSLRTLDFEAS